MPSNYRAHKAVLFIITHDTSLKNVATRFLFFDRINEVRKA